MWFGCFQSKQGLSRSRSTKREFIGKRASTTSDLHEEHTSTRPGIHSQSVIKNHVGQSNLDQNSSQSKGSRYNSISFVDPGHRQSIHSKSMDIADEPKMLKTKEKQSFRVVYLIIYVLELISF